MNSFESAKKKLSELEIDRSKHKVQVRHEKPTLSPRVQEAIRILDFIEFEKENDLTVIRSLSDAYSTIKQFRSQEEQETYDEEIRKLRDASKMVREDYEEKIKESEAQALISQMSTHERVEFELARREDDEDMSEAFREKYPEDAGTNGLTAYEVKQEMIVDQRFDDIREGRLDMDKEDAINEAMSSGMALMDEKDKAKDRVRKILEDMR